MSRLTAASESAKRLVEEANHAINRAQALYHHAVQAQTRAKLVCQRSEQVAKRIRERLIKRGFSQNGFNRL